MLNSFSKALLWKKCIYSICFFPSILRFLIIEYLSDQFPGQWVEPIPLVTGMEQWRWCQPRWKVERIRTEHFGTFYLFYLTFILMATTQGMLKRSREGGPLSNSQPVWQAAQCEGLRMWCYVEKCQKTSFQAFLLNLEMLMGVLKENTENPLL